MFCASEEVWEQEGEVLLECATTSSDSHMKHFVPYKSPDVHTGHTVQCWPNVRQSKSFTDYFQSESKTAQILNTIL